MKKYFFSLFIPVLVILCWKTALFSQAEQQQTVALSDSIGTEIDRSEQQRYHLFPDIKGFQSGSIVRISDLKYRLDYTFKDAAGVHRKSRRISSRALELTRLHIRLSDEYRKSRRATEIDRALEARVIYRLALKYASQARYDMSSKLFADLQADYPESRPATEARLNYPNIEDLWKTRKALIWKGSLLDQSGRTDLLIFSGYYGLWLGIATPIVLKADSPQVFALGLLVGGPVSVLIANSLSRDANISNAKSNLISLGAHLGTWQGLGWMIVAAPDAEGETVVGVSELAGLAGIGAAVYLTNKMDFSEGHAAIMSSGLEWGAWLGLIFAAIADHEEEQLLSDMLIGSDVLILGAGIAARDVRASQGRIRLVNLSGLLGAIFGFGVDMLFEVDVAGAIFAIAGAGSIAGAVLGTHWTRNYDRGKELSLLRGGKFNIKYSPGNDPAALSVSPKFTLLRKSLAKNDFVPGLGLELCF